jgi:hypothetical protein
MPKLYMYCLNLFSYYWRGYLSPALRILTLVRMAFEAFTKYNSKWPEGLICIPQEMMGILIFEKR